MRSQACPMQQCGNCADACTNVSHVQRRQKLSRMQTEHAPSPPSSFMASWQAWSCGTQCDSTMAAWLCVQQPMRLIRWPAGRPSAAASHLTPGSCEWSCGEDGQHLKKGRPAILKISQREAPSRLRASGLKSFQAENDCFLRL